MSLTVSLGLPPLQSSLDQNTTIGRGRLLPTPRDNGRALTCTASNPKVKEYSLNSTHTLQVLCEYRTRALVISGTLTHYFNYP